MIQFHNVSMSYGSNTVLQNLNLNIPKGAVFGLLGPNGAGKSTIMYLLTGFLKASSGNIFFNEEDLFENKLRLRKTIGFVPQEIALYEDFSAIENLAFFGRLYGIKGTALQDRILELLELIGLGNRKNDLLKTYSGGMKRRVNIAVALLHNPRVVLMDEPTVGIDPQSRIRIFEIIEKLKNRGVSIVYTTHYMEEVERLCDEIAIIDKGQILAQGSLDELLSSDLKSSQICISFLEVPSEVDIKLPVIHEWTKGALILNCNKNEELTEVLNVLNLSGLKISNIDFLQPNLEQLFIKLTGTNLRD